MPDEVMDWLEAMRQHVAEHFGDRVEWVRSSTIDHGATSGIAIKTPEGWRHAIWVWRETTNDGAVAALEKWLEVKWADALISAG